MHSKVNRRQPVSLNQPSQTALTVAPALETELASLMAAKEDTQNEATSAVPLSYAATPAEVGELGRDLKHSGVGQPSEFPSLNGRKEQAVPTDAALTALQEDVVKLEQSVAQLKQQKQQALKQRVSEGMQYLGAQADRINALADQLEAEILKFQEMAEQVNRDLCHRETAESQLISGSESQQYTGKPAPLCEVSDCAVPAVVRNGFKFVLAARKVEKFGVTEEDAAQRAAKAQQRREALERWLESRRQRIVDGFSGL
ncbi:hypothetical protein [Kamptonema formosum]|uniref:hypothetical protein n=1 Tax=Kamptonema formosum TaxID=331992 RepID=UPI00035E8C03|nr:hypothetical protein [Oscillatoria sp. PCC 10802]